MTTKRIKVKILITLVLIIMIVAIFAVLRASAQEGLFQGGESTSGTVNISFTIGQTFSSYTEGENVMEFQGVQQAYGRHIVSVQDEIIQGLSVYPNPFHDRLNIKSNKLMQFEIYDINGKLMTQGDTNGEAKVNQLVPAPYFLKIKQDNVDIKTYKLLKR